MALPDNILVKHGTPIIFGEAGASGVTHTLSFDGLADGSAIMSAVADLGENFADEYLVLLMVETGTAPTSGKTAELYLVATYSTSYYPGGVTGSAGAWPSDGNEDEWAKQLGAPVVSLVATNDGTVLQTQAPVIWRPPGRYVVAVFDNNLGYAVRDEATATNNDSRVIIVPRQLVITD